MGKMKLMGRMRHIWWGPEGLNKVKQEFDDLAREMGRDFDHLKEDTESDVKEVQDDLGKLPSEEEFEKVSIDLDDLGNDHRKLEERVEELEGDTVDIQTHKAARRHSTASANWSGGNNCSSTGWLN